jgi:TIR domain/Double zinc ribbon
MAHDVFISYSSRDKPTADAVCAALESHGIRCWIAPRDVLPGMEWGEAIVNAIHNSKVMVMVFSSRANESRHIRREVERAVAQGIAIVPVRIEDIVPSSSLEYFIGSVHWLDALTPPLEQHLNDLKAKIQTLLDMVQHRLDQSAISKSGPVAETKPEPKPTPPPASSVPRFCTECGVPNLKGLKYCTGCGASLSLEAKICAHCGARFSEPSKFCTSCGSQL